jgi:hypothetical protein
MAEDTRYAKHITNFHVPEILDLTREIIANKEYSIRPYFHTSMLASLRDYPDGSMLPDHMSQEDKTEWAIRFNKATNQYGKRVIFDVCKVPDDKRAKLLSLLPNNLKGEEVEITIQDIYDGDFVMPHIDHKRKSSLFYLFTEPDMETVWYTQTEPFKIYDEFRYPDIDKIKRDFTIVMQKDNWYLIDQETWHGAFRLPDYSREQLKRVVLVIQFPELTYKQMLEKLA